MEIVYRPIGIIRSPFQALEDMPIQPTGNINAVGAAEIDPEYAPGLQDLDGFSHLILLYHFHRVTITRMIVTPFLDDRPHGVFATRAPVRPNPLGLSIVRLTGVDGTVLHLADLDVLDGTPLLDIKPYVPAFDTPENPQAGWLASSSKRIEDTRSDTRFIPDGNAGD